MKKFILRIIGLTLCISYGATLLYNLIEEFRNVKFRVREEGLRSGSEKDKIQETPDVFRSPYLWRPAQPHLLQEDRIVFQWDWVANISRSEYMKNVKKKRILITGLFELDDNDKNLRCHDPTINFSRFCQVTQDLWYDPQYKNYDEFDAILSKRDWNDQMYEPKIPPSKQAVFFIQESPYTLHQGDFRVNNPILASYWRGSDIQVPYFKWIPNPDASTRSNKSLVSKNYATGKTKLAAMVASHCPTYNDRLEFVHKLQKYIPIDVYGDCGPFKCGSSCFGMIERDYKFYLAFENANCRDYVTEKFFQNGLGHDIISVVLGAHPEDYKLIAPSGSYIHVEDFKSLRDLADYLTLLDNNDTLYNEYFKWKGSGEVVNGHKDLLCRVCAMLFYADFHPPPQWPNNASRWLNVNPCLKPGQFYWFPDQRKDI